jgi:hypothetical protein
MASSALHRVSGVSTGALLVPRRWELTRTMFFSPERLFYVSDLCRFGAGVAYQNVSRVIRSPHAQFPRVRPLYLAPSRCITTTSP